MACSSGDVTAPAAEPDPSTSTSTPPATDELVDLVVTTAKLGQVTGKLTPQRRTTLVKRMTTTVDEWIDAAYPDGPYPGAGFTDAFDIFTAGAARRAKEDAALMSNAGLGVDVDSVEMLGRTLTIDVLAVGGAAAGVTAHVALKMEISGATDRQERVTGSMFLTYDGGRWHVFGYEMDRGGL